MERILSLIFWTLVGAIGIVLWLNGAHWGWFLIVVSLIGIKGTIWPESNRDDGKEGERKKGGWFSWNAGGDGGCGGCGGCGG